MGEKGVTAQYVAWVRWRLRHKSATETQYLLARRQKIAATCHTQSTESLPGVSGGAESSWSWRAKEKQRW